MFLYNILLLGNKLILLCISFRVYNNITFMQYIPNGPQIPDELIQAHQDGHVVFFCGSGISIPTGLPNFCGLVKQIYKNLNAKKTPIEDKLNKREEYDRVLESLEKRMTRENVRKHLKDILSPKHIQSKTHLSLLRLSESDDGIYRIVTTNFDRIFENVAEENSITINSYTAPLIPMPKREYWNGIVHLHGLIPVQDNDSNTLKNLILTSSDFGIAYLIERWASRFITELFHRYIVCFVGYSANDVILRYMLDALAAENSLNINANPVYAFAEYHEGNQSKVLEWWESKKIIPILYDNKNNHTLLHSTINEWAELYVKGIDGKKQLVDQLVRCEPSKSTEQDDIVGRMVWALSDRSGDVARYFSELDPAPSLKWLRAISKRKYTYSNLHQSNSPNNNVTEENTEFSITNRPSTLDKSMWMRLVFNNSPYCKLDIIMIYLAKWLLRHLNNSDLILWIVEQGGVLHPYFARLIQDHIITINKLDKKRREELLEKSPDAIPSDDMRKLWFLILGNHLKNNYTSNNIYEWKYIYENQGINFTTRKKLSELLSPKIVIEKNIAYYLDEKSNNKLITKVGLAGDHVRCEIKYLNNILEFSSLLEIFQSKLIETLNLLEEIKFANCGFDTSCYDLPSIEPHWQNNQRFEDWVALIELLRDSWLKLLTIDKIKASIIAKEWFNIKYPIFKRLALFAATKTDLISSKIWVDWILADNAFCLWSSSTRREIMRLIYHNGAKLSKIYRLKLEKAILLGPPREIYKDNITDDDFIYIKNRSIWHLLAKLRSSGAILGATAQRTLNNLEKLFPDWVLSKNEKDEFLSWISGTGDPDWEENKIKEDVPYKFKELLYFLRKKREFSRFGYENNWGEFCRKYPRRASFALFELIRSGELDSTWLDSALYTWSKTPELTPILWRYYTKTKDTIPASIIEESKHSISFWLDSISGSINSCSDSFLFLCKEIFNLHYEEKIKTNGSIDDILTDAINHPIGHVANALFNVWFNTKPKDNDGLSQDIKDILFQFCDRNIKKFSYARVFLGRYLIPLYRVDKEWTKKNIIPLFNWDDDKICARIMWAGFFSRNQIDISLMYELKKEFLYNACHYDELGHIGDYFVNMLTYMALNNYKVYTKAEYQKTFSHLMPKAFEKISKILELTIRNSPNKNNTFNHMVKPFWISLENKDVRSVTSKISLNFAQLIIESDSKFKDTLGLFGDYLIPLENSFYVLYKLKETKLCQEYPEQVLLLLSKIIGSHTHDLIDLKLILEDIEKASPILKKKKNFKNLNILASDTSSRY